MKTLTLFLFFIPGILCASAPLRETFLQQYCTDCHGADRQRADRRFDDLGAEITSLDELERWQEIADLLNLEEMPPDAEPQPSDEERAAIISSIQEFVAHGAEQLADSGGHSVLRRLNSWEYQQTIGDLLSLNVDARNPAADFPAEVLSHGFDNNGAELVTSGMLLDHYLLAAEDSILRATHFGERPETQSWAQPSPFYFSGKDKNDLPKLYHVDRFRFIPETPYTDLFGRHYRGGHIGFVALTRAGGVPHSGTYTIRVQAAAVGRTHDYGNAIDNFRNGDPLVLELASVNREGAVTSEGSVSDEVTLALAELTSEEPQWLEWDVYMEQGWEPEVRFRNGPGATKRLLRLIQSRAGDSPEFLALINDPDISKLHQNHRILQAYEGPRLRIWEIQVEGPHIDTWPPEGHTRLYGNLTPDEMNEESILTQVRTFAETAFRRPLADNELAPIENLVSAKLADGLEPLEAMQLGLQTVLCSPGFLYFEEGEGELSPHALASRLSYFLWSSAPDSELLAHAADGSLTEPETLSAEVDRMLADPRSDRFVSHFIRRWLDLDNIGEMPISKEFVEYYRDNLATAMRGETETFFRHILDENLSPSEFLQADYSFLNRELAMHYGIEGIEGNQLQRVSLTDTPRGGLAGHGLLLTASANGVDTSPVVRGVYVLEKLLGYTPPPPPPDVPAIESDVSAGTTVREQLALHREAATCAQCHRKIDPLGFALENYNAIGGWREDYGRNLPIDPSGELPDGSEFTSFPEFRDILATRTNEFTHCLTEKLLTYALGRELEFGDREIIDGITSDLHESEGGLKDLIKAIVLSESFATN